MTKAKINRKCIILLSCKSSGSSACQNLLAKQADISHISNTSHGENETLYWSLSTSILELPQLNMVDSEVPIQNSKALEELKLLLKNNLNYEFRYESEEKLIFNGWKALCEQFSPIFFEKSPHHLYQWSSLELIIQCIERFPEIDFLLIGLVRNPMDTLYSAFTRWKTPPETNQMVWLESYSNLLKLKKRLRNKLLIIRYEDMVSIPDTLSPVFEFCGVKAVDENLTYFHKSSLAKWKLDRFFGFNLSPEVINLAKEYGYKQDDLLNTKSIFWPIYRRVTRLYYRLFISSKKVIRAQLKTVS